MTEKRLFRLSLGVVLWFVVATPYLIPFPGLPGGDLTVSTETCGVAPAGLGQDPMTSKKEVKNEEEEVSYRVGDERDSLREIGGMEGLPAIEARPISEIRGETVSNSESPVRGILIEGGRRSEIVLSFNRTAGAGATNPRETRAKPASAVKTRLATSPAKSSLKGLMKALPDDLFEISGHWNETDFSGPNDVGDLIGLLEGYRN